MVSEGRNEPIIRTRPFVCVVILPQLTTVGEPHLAVSEHDACAPQRAFSRQAASSPAMESEREEQEEDGERRRREHESEHESDGGAERRVAQASAQRASG